MALPGAPEARPPPVRHALDHLDGVLILHRVTSIPALHPRLVPAPGPAARARS